uniref:Uncharacterized protein n=1 Tax=Saccharolobus islandicus TaxID=43080 RepID=Q9HH95_SACIS|nr:hypothetical protein [Sulfolobus islandicus]CAC15838.1 hypothetical protein [Sulfolobus islandicus]
MRANIKIKYRDIEEICYYDDVEKGVICDDYEGEIEVNPEDVTFYRFDLEEIVDDYLDDIIDILLKNHRDALLKKLGLTSS